MTATLALKPKHTTEPTPVVESTPAVEAVETVGTSSPARAFAVVMPSTILVVFAGVFAAFVATGTPAGESVAYAAYLAFWLGGGFGAILSGSIWSSSTEKH